MSETTNQNLATDTKNQNIGELGRAFIAQRTERGISFDDAWDDWTQVNAALKFMLVDCPKVQYYDDPWICGRKERSCIRRIAQQKIGKHIRSPDVSGLGLIAEALNLMKPIRPYHLDRERMRRFLQQRVEATEAQVGYTAAVAEMYSEIGDEEFLEQVAKEIERFASAHDL